MGFEWDEAKRWANLKKLGIDFNRAKEIWQGNFLEAPSPQTGHGEARYLAVGLVHGTAVTVVFTWRKEKAAANQRTEGKSP